MVYEDILSYLGQQNFAVAGVSGNAASGRMTILFNRAGMDAVFCVLINNNGGFLYGPSQIRNLNDQLTAQVTGAKILYIVVTGNPERDKQLVQFSDINVWLVDEREQRLLIYENQPEDFYGLRDGISSSITDTPQAKARTALKRKNWPIVTIILIAVNVIWYIFLTANGDVGNAEYMLSMGASYGPYIFEQHQFWRLITNMFMHFSMSHLASNMIYLGLLGYNIERVAGPWRYLAVYMLSGFGSSVVSAAYYYISGQNTVSAGASGAVYGLIGATVYLMIKNRGRMRPGMLWLRIGIILIFLFYSNYVNDGVDVVAHAAGLGFGILLGMIFLRDRKASP